MPQGTILGPIAFLGMINDAVCDIQTKIWKYVDDLTLGESRGYDSTPSIQPTFDELHDWSVPNHLMLNPVKCHVMQVYFGKKEQPVIDLHIADQLSRRLNCLVLPSSVISSGTAKLTTS